MRCELADRVDQHDGVGAALREAAGTIDRALDDLRLRVERAAEQRSRGRLDAGVSSVQLLTSSGRAPERTSCSSRPSMPFRAPARRRSASVLPACAAPWITTREPRPIGASHSIAFRVTSSLANSKRCVGGVLGSSSYFVASPATSSAERPLMVSTRISDAKRSERRGERYGPPTLSPETSSQRRTWAADTYVVVALLGVRDADEPGAVGQHLDGALDLTLLVAVTAALRAIGAIARSERPAALGALGRSSLASSALSAAPRPRPRRLRRARGCVAGVIVVVARGALDCCGLGRCRGGAGGLEQAIDEVGLAETAEAFQAGLGRES